MRLSHRSKHHRTPGAQSALFLMTQHAPLRECRAHLRILERDMTRLVRDRVREGERDGTQEQALADERSPMVAVAQNTPPEPVGAVDPYLVLAAVPWIHMQQRQVRPVCVCVCACVRERKCFELVRARGWASRQVCVCIHVRVRARVLVYARVCSCMLVYARRRLLAPGSSRCYVFPGHLLTFDQALIVLST